MLFLFVTGKNSAYIEDIFSTIHFPVGMVKIYKYKCTDQESMVDLSAQNCDKRERVLISYADRDSSQGGCYIPLRLGEIIDYEKRDGQIYYKVKLGEYCHKNDINAFSDKILAMLGQDVHQKQAGGQWTGLLAIKYAAELIRLVETTDDSWRYTVEHLAKRKLFQDNYAVFTKMQIEDEKKNMVMVKDIGGDWSYVLVKGKQYRLVISYYIPEYNTNEMTTIPVDLEDSAKICGMLENKWSMESEQNIICACMQPFEVSGLHRTAITMDIKIAEINHKKVQYARKPLYVRVESRMGVKMRRTLIGGSIIGMALFSYLAALPYEAIIGQALNTEGKIPFPSNVLYCISLFAERSNGLFALFCTGVNSCLTYILIKLTGKPNLQE